MAGEGLGARSGTDWLDDCPRCSVRLARRQVIDAHEMELMERKLGRLCRSPR